MFVFHAPAAHTDGDAIVHFKKGDVIHMGDTFFNKMYPSIDTSSGGTIDGVIAAADRGLAIAGDRTKIIPGHGPLGNKADLKNYRDMLAAVAARIKAQIKAGKKFEDIVASKPSADFDEAWGKGYMTGLKFGEMVTKSLMK